MGQYLHAYTGEWNNEESDSLHLEYSYDKESWYAFNGSNGVLFPQTGSKRMKNPVFCQVDGKIYLVAEDAVEVEHSFCYETEDFIHYTETQMPQQTEGSDIIEVTKEQLEAMHQVWGKAEPVVITGFETPQLVVKQGEKAQLPKEITGTYSNGMTENFEVEWETADSSVKGEQVVKGKVYEHQYTNPMIFHRADPFIYKHTDGNYYFTASHTDMEHNLNGTYQYRNITLRKADCLENLGDYSENHEERVIFAREPLPGDFSPHIWAPEIHYIQGAWYVYFTTSTNEQDLWSIRPHVLQCKGDPMKDEWVNLGQVQTTTTDSIAFTEFSLDHTVLQRGDELYLFWAEKHPDSDIYTAKMTNPWTIDSSRVTKVVTPEYNWERHFFPVCEGPAFLQRNGKIFMTYSASATDALYCLGMLTADEDADLLDAASWKKSPYPVFSSYRPHGQFGPGHNSFTYDEKGRDIFVYHARQEEHYLGEPNYEPLYDAGRNTSLMRLYWNPDGTPNFSVPIPNGQGYEQEFEVTAKVVVE